MDIENEPGHVCSMCNTWQRQASIDAVNMGKPLYSITRHSQIGRRFEDACQKLHPGKRIY